MPVVTRAPSDAGRRRATVENAVTDAAAQLLQQGLKFTELSVLQISKEAGVARSTFYVHFADKTDLLVRLGKATTDVLLVDVDAWLHSGYDSGLPGLVDSYERFIATFRSHASVLGAILETAAYEPIIGEYWHAHLDQLIDAAACRLRQDQVDGHIKDDVDVEPLARMTVWMIERTVSRHITDHGLEEDPALARALARGVWLMLYGDAPLPND